MLLKADVSLSRSDLSERSQKRRTTGTSRKCWSYRIRELVRVDDLIIAHSCEGSQHVVL